MTKLPLAVMLATLVAGAAACGGGGGSGSADGTDAPAPRSAALSRAADCDDLLGAIRDDARAKIRVQADELRRGGWVYAGAGEPTPVVTPSPAGTASPGPSRPGTTDTNTQVPGVDETDTVEIDDGRIYLLRNGELLVLNATPPAAMALTERIAIEGWPVGMFVAGGRALVVSFVTNYGAPESDPRCGIIGGPFPLRDGDLRPNDVPCGTFQTKLTVLDVATPPARVVREIYVEGGYVAARRHGTSVRVVTESTFGVPPGVGDPWSAIWGPTPPVDERELVARVDAWERSALAAIDASTLADWLPTIGERSSGGRTERLPTCTGAATPPAGDVPQGSTLILGVDLASDDAPVHDALVLGKASEIYADADTLVLAQPEWQATPLGDADTRTALHVFALRADDTGVAYRGSGFVAGNVLSQYSLDVRNDVVRAATSFWHTARQTTVTRVTTARLRDGTLETLGSTDDLAPGETLRAARYVGDRAYLVTFLQIDPLFVVDVADPAHPSLLGELELPGFSAYLHPLDSDHLLTVGRGSELSPGLRLFDVGDPAHPVLAAEHDLGRDAVTLAEYDPLAFTYDATRGLLALPVDRYPDRTDFGDRATLEIYIVDPVSGIELRGVVDHHTTGFAPCGIPFIDPCGVYEQMLRGVFIDDAVYSISSAKVEVHAVDAPGDPPLATVVLP